jgi:hypothetical protein
MEQPVRLFHLLMEDRIEKNGCCGGSTHPFVSMLRTKCIRFLLKLHGSPLFLYSFLQERLLNNW